MAHDDDPADRGNSPVDGWPPDFERLVIPDDPRELDADVRALARERRAAARAARLRAVFRGRRRSPFSWPVVVSVIALIGILVSLVVAFHPPTQVAPRARPLASSGARQPGVEGGLLPDVQLRRSSGGLAPLRAFRPGVMVLIPAGQDSSAILRSALRVAQKHHVYAMAIGPAVPELPPDLTRSALIRVGDDSHTLLPAYQVTTKPVLLLVRDDGIVNRILPGGAPESSLDPEVVVLSS